MLYINKAITLKKAGFSYYRTVMVVEQDTDQIAIIVLNITLNHGFSIFIYNKKQLSTSAVLQLHSVDPVMTEGLISSIFVLSSQVYLIMLFCPLLP